MQSRTFNSKTQLMHNADLKLTKMMVCASYADVCVSTPTQQAACQWAATNISIATMIKWSYGTLAWTAELEWCTAITLRWNNNVAYYSYAVVCTLNKDSKQQAACYVAGAMKCDDTWWLWQAEIKACMAITSSLTISMAYVSNSDVCTLDKDSHAANSSLFGLVWVVQSKVMAPDGLKKQNLGHA